MSHGEARASSLGPSALASSLAAAKPDMGLRCAAVLEVIAAGAGVDAVVVLDVGGAAKSVAAMADRAVSPSLAREREEEEEEGGPGLRRFVGCASVADSLEPAFRHGLWLARICCAGTSDDAGADPACSPFALALGVVLKVASCPRRGGTADFRRQRRRTSPKDIRADVEECCAPLCLSQGAPAIRPAGVGLSVCVAWSAEGDLRWKCARKSA
mmetsp:Transcript_17502/g.47949  ORF Transcript_17502/g.47949 Transcript_17502/m.47949 type:complete len:213 (-) Transcript_17502:1209-1847(-)